MAKKKSARKAGDDDAPSKALKRAAKKASKKASKKAADKGGVETVRSQFDANPVAASAKAVEHSVQVLESAKAVERKSNRPTSFAKLSDIRAAYGPCPHFYWQYLLGSAGFKTKSLVELIGPTGVGKSTTALTIAGWYRMQGSPVLKMECEGKPVPGDRAVRMMCPDSKLAVQMLEGIVEVRVRSLREFADKLEEWLKLMRGVTTATVDEKRTKVIIPMERELFVIVDPLSKLLSPDEAAGFLDYADYMHEDNKKKLKETGVAHAPVHAKWFSSFCRRLPAMHDQYNFTMLVVWHQNDDFEMGGGKSAPSFIPKHVLELGNTKHIGGRSMGQNSASTIVMVPKGVFKRDGKTVSGEVIALKGHKQSYGERNRIISMELRSALTDTPGRLDQIINLDHTFARWLATEGYMGVTASGSSYSCPSLGLESVTPEELSLAFHANSEAVKWLGKSLRIEGYEDVIDAILSGAHASSSRLPDLTEPQAAPAAPAQAMAGASEEGGDDEGFTADEQDADQ